MAYALPLANACATRPGVLPPGAYTARYRPLGACAPWLQLCGTCMYGCTHSQACVRHVRVLYSLSALPCFA